MLHLSLGLLFVIVSTKSDSYTISQYASQLGQIDLDSITTTNTLDVNLTAFIEMVDQGRIGSIFNSPSSGGTAPVPSVDWWRWLTGTLHNISSDPAHGGIPILYGLDSVHGANYIFNSTIFPQQIGIAATFNTSVARVAGRVTAIETRYGGIPWVFAPILGLAVQPSWGRVYETFGEDPFLVTEMGVAIVEGLQQPPPASMGLPAGTQLTVAACMKHFVGYTNVRTGRDRTPSNIPLNELMQYFVPPFAAAIERAGVASVMENYIELNGRSVVGSELLLVFLLRQLLDFDGVLVTDYNEAFNLHDFHHAAVDYTDALRVVLSQTSIDMIMMSDEGSFPPIARTVMGLINNGTVTVSRIQDSGTRIIKLKERLGLFDGSPVPRRTATPDSPNCTFACDEHRRGALDAARQSIVLLQNDGILPFKSVNSIAVVGEACDSVPLMAGGWTVRWQGTNNRSYLPGGQTLVEALRSRYPAASITFSRGCNITEGSSCGDEYVNEALQNAANAGLVIYCVGETHYAEKPGDIDDITLPGGQIELGMRLAIANPNVTLVLIEGRPRVLKELPSRVRAAVMAFLPGPAGGQALVDVLSGSFNPSGRLPLTYPKTVNNAPIQHYRKYSANTENDYTVQWTFGWGLQYSTFLYDDISVEAFETTYRISVSITNEGPLDGGHSVLLYASQLYRPITPEVQLLVGFEKVWLGVGAKAIVNFTVQHRALDYYDEYLCRRSSAGPVTFTVGSLTVKVDHGDFVDDTCVKWADWVGSHAPGWSRETSGTSALQEDVLILAYAGWFFCGLILGSVTMYASCRRVQRKMGEEPLTAT